MQSTAKTVKQYLAELPADRKKAIEEVRKLIRKNLDKNFQEVMQYGMISYVVPLKLFPDGYLGKKDVPLTYLSIASQKNNLAIYMMHIYGDAKLSKWFKDEYKKSGKKLDMGQSCLRFKKLEDLNLDLVGKAASLMKAADFIDLYKNIKTK